MIRKNLLLKFFTVAVIALCVVAVFDLDGAERKLCDAGSIYDLLDDDLIELYEREIAGESVVSNKSQAQLERTAKRIGVEVNKLKAIMLLQDFASITGRDVSLSELAQMSDVKLFGYFKQCGNDYLSTLSEERKEELKQMLSAALKMPIKF